MKKNRIIICFLFYIFFTITLAVNVYAETPKNAKEYETDWTICMYLCNGYNETWQTQATDTLIELIDTKISPNIRMFVMTGGTVNWDNKGIGEAKLGFIKPSSTHAQLYEIKNNEMVLLKDYQVDQSNMGEPDTFKTFINDCVALAPSKQIMTVYSGHGGGPHGKSMRDHLFNDFLTLEEIQECQEYVYNLREKKKTDLVLFECCTMSSFEVACAISDYCSYMLAAEDVILGVGFDYHFLDALYDMYEEEKMKTIDAKKIGKLIIDYYPINIVQRDRWEEVANYIIALVDLSKINDLKEAFKEMSNELKETIDKDENAVCKLIEITNETKQMYGNGGLIDLYDFAKLLAINFPEVTHANEVIKTLGVMPVTYNSSNASDVENDPSKLSSVIIYRGATKTNTKPLGLYLFFPTISLRRENFNDNDVKEMVARYIKYDISDSYSKLIEYFMNEIDDYRYFSSDMKSSYEKNGQFKLILPNEKDRYNISEVNFLNFVSQINQDGDKKYCLLERTKTDSNMDEMTFTKTKDKYCFGFRNQPCTLTYEKKENREYFYIPIAKLGELDEDYTIHAHRDAGDENVYIDYYEVHNGEKVGYYPVNEDLKFYPILIEYDNDTMETDYYNFLFFNDSPIIAPYDEEKSCCILKEFSMIPLNNGKDEEYVGCFEIIDERQNAFYSSPINYNNFNSISEILSRLLQRSKIQKTILNLKYIPQLIHMKYTVTIKIYNNIYLKMKGNRYE